MQPRYAIGWIGPATALLAACAGILGIEEGRGGEGDIFRGADIFLGADFDGQRRFFDGVLDEVAWYEVELGAARIACHHAAGWAFGMTR